jgi:VanZ family protein
VAVAYAVTDEVHQHFVAGRHSSAVDVVIDAAGIALGILAFQLTRPRLPAWVR